MRFVSLEMTATELALRLLAGRTGISAERLRRGTIEEQDMRNLMTERLVLADMPLQIDTQSALTIAQLTTRLRRAHRRSPLDLVVVDYLQRLHGSQYRGGQNRVHEITEISGGLKAIATDLNVPVLALSQLNRAVENREGNRPQLSDLRDSGSIEQDADIVAFAHRPEYYLRSPDAGDPAAIENWQAEMSAAEGKAEVILAKHRHGPIGTAELAFDKKSMTFRAPAR